MKVLNLLIMTFLSEAIFLCLLCSYFFVSNPHSEANFQSTATLVIFNVLFVSLMFPLKGSTNKKLGLLTIGNVIGLCWNLIFNYFDVAGTIFFGESFNNIYMFFFPFVSSFWIISFWSLCLTILQNNNISKEKGEEGY